LRIEASFVLSAASATDFPRDDLAEIAMVGRSNVGKSSLINALVRKSVARTSAAPGKTRLANVYRVARGASQPLYLVDLPGYGYARGDARDLDEVTRAYFGRAGRNGQDWRDFPVHPAVPAAPAPRAALLLVDARHPGLESDLDAWQWMNASVGGSALVATKIDKLGRGERIRALREIQSAFCDPVLPVSAATGEGLEELWKLIDNLANNPNPTRPRNHRSPAAAAPLRKR
jgi:GTP-binding protein